MLLGLLGVNFALLSLSMPEMTPEYKSRLLTRATSKTLLIGAEEGRWLRLLLHQHSSAGSVMDPGTSIDTQGPVRVNSALLSYGMLGNDA